VTSSVHEQLAPRPPVPDRHALLCDIQLRLETAGREAPLENVGIGEGRGWKVGLPDSFSPKNELSMVTETQEDDCTISMTLSFFDDII